MAHYKLGQLYLNTGCYSGAESPLIKSRDIWKKTFGSDNRWYGAALLGLAWVYYFLERYEEMEQTATNALDIFERALGPDHQWISYCLKILDTGYTRKKEYGPDHWQIVEYLGRLADIEVERGNWEQVKEIAVRALKLPHYSGSSPPNLQDLLGRAYCILGEPEKSLATFRGMIEKRQETISDLFWYASEEQKLIYLRKHALLVPSLVSFAVQHNSEDSRRVLLNMVLKGKARVIDAVAAERQIAFCSDDDRLTEKVERHATICAQIANLSITLANQPSVVSFSDSLESLSNTKNTLEAELSGLCEDFREELESYKFTVDDVANSLPGRRVLLEFVKYRQYNFEKLPNSENWDESRYAVILLNNLGQTSLIKLEKSSLIDSLVLDCRQALQQATTKIYGGSESDLDNKLASITNQLYSLIFAPLEQFLKTDDHIFISPDGILNLLPFDILSIGNARYLIEKYKFSYLSSGRDLLRYKNTSEYFGDRAVIMANPDYNAVSTPDASMVLAAVPQKIKSSLPTRSSDEEADCLANLFGPLMATSKEGAAVAKLLSNKTDLTIAEYYEASASEDLLKGIKQPPRILHLATHGYYCANARFSNGNLKENPLLYSGLALAGANNLLANDILDESTDNSNEDGILTALEASGLNLMGTDLVVLSACHSGVGQIQSDGEGVYGLRRAFQHAGARSIVMSLFAVPDKSTSTLMKRFYSNWLSGSSKAAALRNASLSIIKELREEHGTAHPLFWGGFILTGDPD